MASVKNRADTKSRSPGQGLCAQEESPAAAASRDAACLDAGCGVPRGEIRRIPENDPAYRLKSRISGASGARRSQQVFNRFRKVFDRSGWDGNMVNFPDMDLSRGQVMRWAPSDVLAEGAKLQASGAVQGVRAQGELLAGSVRMGASRLVTRLRVREGRAVEVLCPCGAAKGGKVCRHAVAVGLQWAHDHGGDTPEETLFAAERAPTRLEIARWAGPQLLARAEELVRRREVVHARLVDRGNHGRPLLGEDELVVREGRALPCRPPALPARRACRLARAPGSRDARASPDARSPWARGRAPPRAHARSPPAGGPPIPFQRAPGRSGPP